MQSQLEIVQHTAALLNTKRQLAGFTQNNGFMDDAFRAQRDSTITAIDSVILALNAPLPTPPDARWVTTQDFLRGDWRASGNYFCYKDCEIVAVFWPRHESISQASQALSGISHLSPINTPKPPGSE